MRTPGLAAVFPGQGTQRVGMAHHLLRESAAACSARSILSDLLGSDLAHLMERGPEEVLRPTKVAQAVVFVGAVAAYDVLAREFEPVAVAGHSVGELAACWAAGAIELGEAARLIAARGTLMSEAPAGAMLAVIGLTRDELAALVEGREGICLALHNGERDVVLSGAPESIDAMAADLSGLACRTTVLRTSHAFHSPDFTAATTRWREVLADAEIADPVVPVAMNANGTLARDGDHIRSALGAVMSSEVRWVECVRALRESGIETFIECGDSQSLCRLGRGHGGTWHSFHVRNDWRRLPAGRRSLIGAAS